MPPPDAAPEPDRPSDPPALSRPPTAPAKAPRRRPSVAFLVGLLALALASGAVAGLQYQGYAAVHLRKPAKLPRCILKSSMGLRKPALSSGTEARENAAGETVYLTRAEDRAVGCASLIDMKLSRQLAGALAEQDPALRAQAFLKLVRDDTPADPAFDRQAVAAYMFASSVFKTLPQDSAEIRAAQEEIDLLQTCRFDTKRPCPTRPPIPPVVWLTGVPAAAAVLGLGWIGGSAGVAALQGWWRRRKQRVDAKRKARP